MARPFSKSTVDLAEPAVRVSRIRRDPPPATKPVTAVEVRDTESRSIVIGVGVMALALFIAIAGFGTATDWSPAQHRIHVTIND